MKIHRNIEVFGRVQGVYFRASAMNKAVQLGITGFVCNTSDGSVYIEVEGTNERIDRFIEWCRTGPSGAKVVKVSISDGALSHFEEFHIRYGS